LNSNEEKVVEVFEMKAAKRELTNIIAKKFEIETKRTKSKQQLYFYLAFLLWVSKNYRLFWLISRKLKK